MKVFTESKYLKHEELDGHDWDFTVDRVERHEMKNNEGQKEQKFVVFFKEMEKGMILNATNMKTITKLMGTNESDEWKGNRITVYTKDDIEMGGEMKSGLRVRPKAPVAKV
jgi:hypothetical protein